MPTRHLRCFQSVVKPEVSHDGPTVLLVDDEPLFLDVFSFHVERHGGRVLRATSAEAALQILEQQQVDLVVTDYDMPHLDGAMLRRKIRRRVRTATPTRTRCRARPTMNSSRS